MTVLSVNFCARDGGLVSDWDALSGALRTLPPASPVILMIHGFRYAPGTAKSDPHATILAMDPARRSSRTVSWPAGLGAGQSMGPLCIGFGWPAQISPWHAYANARRAGSGLAELINRIRVLRPNRSVHILAHSLGARVALSALPELPVGAVGQAVFLAPAEVGGRAKQCIDTPAGRAAEIVTVTSRENGLFDGLVEWLFAPHCPGERALGQGTALRQSRWTTIQIDSPATLRALQLLGYPVAPPSNRICHWSGYTRPGLLPLYAALFDGRLSITTLRAVLDMQQHRGQGQPSGMRSVSVQTA